MIRPVDATHKHRWLPVSTRVSGSCFAPVDRRTFSGPRRSPVRVSSAGDLLLCLLCAKERPPSREKDRDSSLTRRSSHKRSHIRTNERRPKSRAHTRTHALYDERARFRDLANDPRTSARRAILGTADAFPGFYIVFCTLVTVGGTPVENLIRENSPILISFFITKTVITIHFPFSKNESFFGA